MHKAYKPEESEKGILCPECSSKNVVESDEEVECTDESLDNLIEYVCNDCKCRFIPAMIPHTGSTKMNAWETKLRTNEGLNEGRSWKKVKPFFIILKKKQK